MADSRLSWIDESGDREPDRPIFIKRPDPSALPRHLAAALDATASSAGYLEKVSPSPWFGSARWQPRYWELRGTFLLYFGAPASSLLGAWDLSGFESAKLFSGVLTLESRDHTVRLRPAPIKNTRNPPLAEWLAAVIQIINAAHSDVEKPPSQQLEVKDGHAEIEIHRVFQEKQELSSVVNPFQNKVPFQDAGDSRGGGGFELKPLGENALGPSSSNTHSSNSSSNEGALVADVGAAAPMPKLLSSLLVLAGVKEGNWPNVVVKDVQLSRVWFWAARFLILGFSAVFAIIMLASELGDLDNCSAHPRYVEDKNEPCLYVASNTLVAVVFLAEAAFVMLWLIRYCTESNVDILKTHRERIAVFVNPIAVCSISFTVASMFLFSVTWGLESYFSDEVESTTGRIIVNAVFGLCLGLVSAPLCALATLYYAETRRLRFMIKDFVLLLKRSPFNFGVVAPAYGELASEFIDLEDRMGFIVGNLVMSFSVLAAYDFICTFYWGELDSLLVRSQIFCYLVFVLGGLGCTLGAQIAANKRADNIRSICGTIIFNSCEKDSAGIVLLLTAMKESPCELRIFGVRITSADITYLVGFLIVIQILHFLGLGDAFGQ